MQSPLTNFFALVGVVATVYYFGWNNWFVQQWIKWRTAAPKEAQQIERVIKPVTQTVEQIQKQTPLASTPSPAPTATPKPEKKYGVRFELKTPIGSINSGTQITPEDQDRLTRKDLGEK